MAFKRDEKVPDFADVADDVARVLES